MSSATRTARTRCGETSASRSQGRLTRSGAPSPISRSSRAVELGFTSANDGTSGHRIQARDASPVPTNRTVTSADRQTAEDRMFISGVPPCRVANI